MNSLFTVLDPKGWIALQERGLFVRSILLMLIVVIPVFFMTILIAWRYRASNRKAKYTPSWDRHPLLEFIWWGLPCGIIAVLAVMAWQSSHELDPYKPISSSQEPITIQAVALQWKWLFIYPEQGIASMNYMPFPANRPINLQITADAPMNSLWIPQLGGQMYAMPGMKTHLHLIADEMGSYRGSSANISGRGFANMYFTAQATSQEEFDGWVTAIVKDQKDQLTFAGYNLLAKPSDDHPEGVYVIQTKDLFDQIIMKYMMP